MTENLNAKKLKLIDAILSIREENLLDKIDENLKESQKKERKSKQLSDALELGYNDIKAGRCEEFNPEVVRRISKEVIARNS